MSIIRLANKRQIMTTPQIQEQTLFISNGISLHCNGIHQSKLHLIIKQLGPLSELLRHIDSSPKITDYFDEAADRFVSANNYSVKGRNLLVSRLEKLKSILTEHNRDRVMADLGSQDISLVKGQVRRKTKQNSRSKSRGQNTQTYYQLFNRVMGEAKNDCIIADHLTIKGQKTKFETITKPFLPDDLHALTTAWPYITYTPASARSLKHDAHPFKFWLIPLGLFTGARLNELCQLRISDIQTDEHGVPVVSINDNGGHKSLKTDQSRRSVPLCNALLAMGFMDFVEEQRKAHGKNSLLFPELTYSEHHLYSRSPSRFFCGERTGDGFIGRHCPAAVEGALNFKSFRRSFALRLEAAGTPDNIISHLLGHIKRSNAVTQKHYLNKPYSVLLLDILNHGLLYGIDTGHMNWANYRQLRGLQEGRGKRGRKTAGPA
jgi:integrase